MKQLQRLWSTSTFGPGALGALPNNTHNREKLLHMEEEQLSELLELLEPAAQPVTSRKGKRKAPAEEDQQLEPSRARKGNSDGQWRVQEKYGFTHNMMALYEWASVVEGHPEFVECVTCTMVKNQPVRLQARPQTLKQHAETKGHKDSSGAAHRVAEVAAFQEAARAGNKASFDKAVAKADEEKLVQFKTCFHLLKHGRAMLQYEQALELLTALGVPKLPFMHWGDNAGCYKQCAHQQPARGQQGGPCGVSQLGRSHSHRWSAIHGCAHVQGGGLGEDAVLCGPQRSARGAHRPCHPT